MYLGYTLPYWYQRSWKTTGFRPESGRSVFQTGLLRKKKQTGLCNDASVDSTFQNMILEIRSVKIIA